VDLFAGLGGFHLALNELGHKCVFACEIDEKLSEFYTDNFGIEVEKTDIRKIDIKKIKKFDILCAGFPCQPFSKAGKQEGRNDTERGTLFDEIVKILKHHKPEYLILENVPFIRKHDNERTWKYIKSKLEELGYTIDYDVFSPHEFGIPQHRERIFIIGCQSGLEHFSFGSIPTLIGEEVDIRTILDTHPSEILKLDEGRLRCLEIWQKFIDKVPKKVKIPVPLWGMEFGATYPYEETFPYAMKVKELAQFKGSFGVPLNFSKKVDQLKCLPSYARVDRTFPAWKKRYIFQSRELYQNYKRELAVVVKEIEKLKTPSWQKLEWNVGNRPRNIKDYLLQFRSSGIRVKTADLAPSIVTIITQVPIIGWENRYLSRTEVLKLQSFPVDFKLPKNDAACFRALGNAVNVHIVKLIAEQLLKDKKKK